MKLDAGHVIKVNIFLIRASNMDNNFKQFRNRIIKPTAFKLFALRSLPAAFFAGLRIESLDETKAVVSVKQKWFNKNPFRSIYFAILSMAAELSTGVLGMGNIYKSTPAISMLVTEQRGVFHKKATGKIIFVCEEGNSHRGFCYAYSRQCS